MKLLGKEELLDKVSQGETVKNLDDKLKEDETFKLQGRISFRGLDIAVENRKGSVRRGVDDDGEEWETKMFYPYGYIRGVIGVDGDNLDCYVNTNRRRDDDPVFVINQVNPETKEFDEQKVMLGFETKEGARDAYLAHYNSQKFLGDILEIPFDEFKEKIQNASKKKPTIIKAFGIALMKAVKGQFNLFNNDQLDLFDNGLSVGDTKQGKHGTLVVKKNPSGHGAHLEYLVKNEPAQENSLPEPEKKTVLAGMSAEEKRDLIFKKGLYDRFKRGIKEGQLTEEKFKLLQQMGNLISDKDYELGVLAEQERNKEIYDDPAEEKEAAPEVSPASEQYEDVDAKVEDYLNKRQEGREFKDVNQRVPLSKKEIRAYSRFTVDDLAKLDSNSAAVLVTKSRIFPEFDFQAMKESGEPAGLVYIKKKLVNSLAAKPEDSDIARKNYVETLPKIANVIETAKSINELVAGFKDIFDWKYSRTRASYVEIYSLKGEKAEEKINYVAGRRVIATVGSVDNTFGKAFLNLANGRSTETLKEAKKLNGITQEESIELVNRAIENAKITSSRHTENFNKTTRKEHEDQLADRIFRLQFGKKKYRTRADVKKDPEFGKHVDDYIKRERERIYKDGDEVANLTYNEFIEKHPQFAPQEPDWSWMNAERKEKTAGTGIKIHNNPPLAYIKRVNGRVVTDAEVRVESLPEQFGYKSVQLGHYVKDNEAKAHIKRFVESMKDLEDVLDIDLAKLHDAGDLSIAFGARGKGRALAHFEPRFKIINLTKKQGDGTISHEWGHFLDFFLAKQVANSNDGLSNLVGDERGNNVPVTGVSTAVAKVMNTIRRGTGEGEVKTFEPINGYRWNSLKEVYQNKGLSDAISYVLKNSNPTQIGLRMGILASIVGQPITATIPKYESEYVRNSSSVGSEYWIKSVELFARAMEAYTQDKLAEKGMYNNYLVANNENLSYYPQGKERELLKTQFDSLFSELRAMGYGRTNIPVEPRENTLEAQEASVEENTETDNDNEDIAKSVPSVVLFGKSFGSQIDMFSQNNLFGDNDVVEGQVRMKNGKMYQVQRSKKNPNVKRIFRMDSPEEKQSTKTEQFDLFGQGADKKEEKEQPKTKLVVDKNGKLKQQKEQPQFDLFGSGNNETAEKKDEPVKIEKPEVKKDEQKQPVKPKVKQDIPKGKKNRVDINAQVKELLNSKKNEEMDEADLALIAKYTGRGGLAEAAESLDDISLNEFYTRDTETKFMWDMLSKLGFRGGTVLEPSCGVGTFISTAPDDALCTGIEYDETSGRISQILHGENHDIRVSSFEDFVSSINNFGAEIDGQLYDAVIGNCPFGRRGITAMADPAKMDIKTHEQYFVDRGIDMLREDGLMAMIVPTGVMDNQINEWRLAINKKAEFLGAIRMPTGAFKHADAQVTTDIVFFKKRPQEICDFLENIPKDKLGEMYDNMILDADFISGKFFDNNPEYALGEKKQGQFGSFIWKGELKEGDLERVGELLKTESSNHDKIGLPDSIVPEKELQVGDVKILNGRTYRLNENHRWERVDNETKFTAEIPEEVKNLGITSWAEWKDAQNNFAKILTYSREELEVVGGLKLERIAREVKSYQGANDYQEEYLRKAVIIGLEMRDFKKNLQDGKLSAEDALQQGAVLKAALIEFYEKFGDPINTLKLSKYFRQTQYQPLLHFAGAFEAEGKPIKMLDDPNAFYKVYQPTEQVGELDRNSLTSVVQFLFENNYRADIDTIKTQYDGNPGDVEKELLAESDIFIDEFSNYKPKEEVLYGNIYDKIDAWEKEREQLRKLLSDPELDEDSKILINQRERKLESQIIEAKSRAGIKELKYLPVMWTDAGNLFDIKLLNDYLTDKLGFRFASGLQKDPSGMLTPDDETIRGLYHKYAGMSKEVSKDDEKQIKELFSGDNHPLYFMLLNKINGLPVAALRTAEGIEKKEKIAELEADFKNYLSDLPESDVIAEKYNRMFNGYIQKVYDSSPIMGLSKFDYERIIDHERGLKAIDKIGGHVWAAVRRMYDQGKGMLAHGVGLGKAQPLDALILTPEGYVNMGDVYVGQDIINSRGEVSKITGIYPQGELDAYEVEFTDGSKVVCNDEHLWAVRTEKQQGRNKPFSVLTLKEIIPNIYTDTKVKHLNYRIPIVQSIEFRKREVTIDPYLLGLILGDGSIAHHVIVSFNQNDTDIIDFCREQADKYGLNFTKTTGDYTSYAFTGGQRGGKENKLLSELREFGLMGKKAAEKSVPKMYLFNDKETRLAVLQGLIDTDGYISKDGMTIQYTTVSSQLKEDVKFLVQSFGGIVKEHAKTGRYKNTKGIYVDCQLAYTLTISLPSEIVCVRSKRRLERFVPKTKYQPNRIIKSVKHIGKAEMQCISVDSSDHLYITNNMVLTHNTITAINLILLNLETGKTKKPLVITPNSVLINWANEIDKWTKDVNYIVVGYSRDENGQWTKKDSREEKMLKLQRIASGNYDMVLMSQDTFESIDFSPETKKNMLNELVDKYYPEGQNLHVEDDSKRKKSIMKKRDTVLLNLSKQMENAGALEGIYLDNLGFDMIVRDEYHSCKNLLQPLSIDSVSGINATTSQRAMQNLFASKIIRGQNQEKGFYGLTATPISNSPLEVFNMMLPFAEKELDNLGITNMDQFINRFANIDNVPTTDADGRVKVKKKFAGWKSGEALRSTFFRFVDYKVKDDVESVKANIKFPKEKPNNVLSTMNEGQKEIVKQCKLRLWMLGCRKYDKEAKQWVFDDTKLDERVKGQIISQEEANQVRDYYENVYLPRYAELNQYLMPDETPNDDHFFKVQQDLIKAGSDLDWYLEGASEYSHKVDSSFVEKHREVDKFKQLAENTLSIHKSGGKQIIFAINTKLHEKIKKDLIAAGVPEKEIIIVNGDTVKKASQRVQISTDYNAGKYKVVIGNYATMGEGLNFNYMTSDIHHLQPAWNYLQIEQGNGRGIRQGNPLDNVNTHYYLTKGSIDGFMNTKIMEKGGMVDKFLRGETSRWDDEVQLDADEMMIELSDNPEQAKMLLAYRNQKLQDAIKAQATINDHKNLSRLYELKRKMERIDDKTSKQYQMLSEEATGMSDKLIASEDFKHKEKLNFDETPIILPEADKVIPVGSILRGKGGQFYVVNSYTPSTGRIQVKQFDTEGRDSVSTLLWDIKSLKQNIGKIVDESDYTQASMYEHLAESGKMDIAVAMPLEALKKNKSKILEAMQKNGNMNYEEMAYQTMTGEIQFKEYRAAKSEIDSDGGRFLFPQEIPNFPKLLKDAIAKEKASATQKYISGAAERYAKTVYGYDYEEKLNREIKKLSGEGASASTRIHTKGAKFIAKVNELSKKGVLGEWSAKNMKKDGDGGLSIYRKDEFQSALMEEFLQDHGIKEDELGNMTIPGDLKLTPEKLEYLKEVRDFAGRKSVIDDYNSIIKHFGGESEIS